MVENEEIVQAYLLTRNQVLIDPGGNVVDIHIPAVKIVMDLLEVKDQKRCFFAVKDLFTVFRPRKENEGS